MVCPGTGWGPARPNPEGQGFCSSLASPGPLGPGAGLHLLPHRATLSSLGCHLSGSVSLGQFSPIPPHAFGVSCLGRGWRGISWTVRDTRGIGRGAAAAVQSLPLQVSVYAPSLCVCGGGDRERAELRSGSPVGQASHHPTTFTPAPCGITPNICLGGCSEAGW